VQTPHKAPGAVLTPKGRAPLGRTGWTVLGAGGDHDSRHVETPFRWCGGPHTSCTIATKSNGDAGAGCMRWVSHVGSARPRFPCVETTWTWRCSTCCVAAAMLRWGVAGRQLRGMCVDGLLGIAMHGNY
jgi:hypothetical protein